MIAEDLELGRPAGLRQRHGLIEAGELGAVLTYREVIESLVERRLALRSPISGRIHALSRLVRHLH